MGEDGAVKLPTLPGRFNEPIPKILVLFVATPLLACCGLGMIGAAIGDGDDPADAADPTFTSTYTSNSPADATTSDGTGAEVATPPAAEPTTAVPTTEVPAVDPPAPPPPPPPAPEPPPAVYYANCDAVRAAGAAPLYRGQPGYRSGLDRDNDGVACE